jgi:predicted GNAT family N-acyltransferase
VRRYNFRMQDSAQFSVRRADWQHDAAALGAVRRAVFVEEQRVPEWLEWDGLDVRCLHVLAAAPDGAAIGTGRLVPDGHIGRMAVLKAWRGRGVGGALLAELIAAARAANHAHARLNAQTHALGFYARFGFMVEGPEFDEAGIPHRAMVLALS